MIEKFVLGGTWTKGLPTQFYFSLFYTVSPDIKETEKQKDWPLVFQITIEKVFI